MDCPKSKTPHSVLELHNRLEPAFVPPTVEEDFLRSTSIKGKTKSTTQVPEQSKDNGILYDEPSGKKLKDSKPSTSSSTNSALFTNLETFTSLRIKTKILQTTQCSYDNDSFQLILNGFF